MATTIQTSKIKGGDNQLTQPDRQCGFILYPHEYQQKSFFAIQRRKVGLKILVIIIFSFPFLKKRKKKKERTISFSNMGYIPVYPIVD